MSKFSVRTSKLTTGETPVDVHVGRDTIYSVESGGTGDEYIHLHRPPVDENGYATEKAGMRVIFTLRRMADSGDAVRVKLVNYDGSGFNNIFDFQQYPQRYYHDIKLNYPGAAVCFVWTADCWLVDTVY